MAVTIAIVEDDAEVRRIVAGWINSANGFRCVGEHGSAESALESIPEEKPEIVLSDVNLPGMSGVECVRRLKLKMPETQFVMLTVCEDSDQIFNALAAGASGYLLKSTKRAELLAALADVQSGGSPMSSHVARKVVQSFRRFSAATPEMQQITKRETEVLELLARGYAFKEAADALGISVTTIGTHVRRIYEKLQVHSRAQAVAVYTKVFCAAEFWRAPFSRLFNGK